MSKVLMEPDSHIVISSDTNNSPDFNSSLTSLLSKINETNSMAVSDTELEEGEIEDEDDEYESSKSIISVHDVGNSNTSTKRKSSDHYSKVNKKFRSETYEQNIQDEEFSWSDLRILVAGDERVSSLRWDINPDFPKQELCHVPKCDLDSLGLLVEKNIHKEYDIVLLVAFHYDFICIDRKEGLNRVAESAIDLKSDININEILKKVKKCHFKWQKEFPETYIIWTVPSPPDFYKYNSSLLKEKGQDPEAILNRKDQSDISKNYFALTRKFIKEWKLKNAEIPLFSLNNVLFMKRHWYKRTFIDEGLPKFPHGYLRKGMYPTKMMSVYFAYLLVEYLLEREFFPHKKFGLDLQAAEHTLIENDPEMAHYINLSDKHNYAKKHNKHKRHRLQKRQSKWDSASSYSSGSRSRSRSRSQSKKYRRRSSSRYRSKMKHRSKHKHRSKSVSSSSSSIRSRSSHSSSSNRTRHSRSKSKSCNRSKKRNRRSLSKSTSDSQSSEKFLNNCTSKKEMDEKTSMETTMSAEPKDEVSFFKTLRYLREVHEIQCALYRRKPYTHPQYKQEKEKFFKTNRNKITFIACMSKWEEYWKKRLEIIFEETWKSKKDQLMSDLNEKGAFTSLNNVNDRTTSANPCLETERAISHFVHEQRLKFKEENIETVKNYLEEIDTTHESSQSSENCAAGNKPKFRPDNFTLSDIFEDNSTAKNERNCDNANNDSSSFPQNENNSKFQGVSAGNANGTDDMSLDSDIDLDMDGLMENPEFLQGLEEIDRELQNAAPIENKVNNHAEKRDDSRDPIPKDDLASIFKSDNDEGSKTTSATNENLKAEFVNVLQMLFRVSKRLGHLGVSITELYNRALDDLKNPMEKFQSLNADSESLLLLVDKKLNLLLKDNLPQVQKAIYGEISSRLQGFLNKVGVENKNQFTKVNVRNIATATLGQGISEVISFIRNTLLYHGYTQFTSEDVMSIYMSVKASQAAIHQT